MSAKRSKHVRQFWRAAAARLEEAVLLRQHGYTLAAVYLAGYAVECGLKALVLTLTVQHEQPERIKQFKGVKAHDFGWLLSLYRLGGGPSAPPNVVGSFTDLGVWATDLRYVSTTEYDGDVDEFFAAVETVTGWLAERL